MSEDTNDDFKYIVRIANTNIDGKFKVQFGLSHIKGIGHRVASRIVRAAKISKDKKMGDLTDSEIEKISDHIGNTTSHLPSWMLNRRKDYETGEDKHILSSDLEMIHRDDLNRLKKIRCYRGVRHERGMRVRGQRTRANNRTGLAMGVSKRRS